MKRGLTVIQAGVTLVELLLATSISVVVVLALTHSFVVGTNTSQSEHALQQLQATALYSSQLLALHIRRAAYLGDSAARTITSTPVTSGSRCTDANWTMQQSPMLAGTNQNATQYPCLLARSSYRWLRSDTITVRYAAGTPVKKYYPQQSYLRARLSELTLFKGINRRQLNRLSDQPYSDRQFHSNSFYVANSSLGWCNNKRTPVLAMIKRSNQGRLRRTLIAAGVEDLQIQYSSNFSEYRNANQVNNWNSIKSVRFWLLLRTLCHYYKTAVHRRFSYADVRHDFHDRFRRQLFSLTVTLRNR